MTKSTASSFRKVKKNNYLKFKPKQTVFFRKNKTIKNRNLPMQVSFERQAKKI